MRDPRIDQLADILVNYSAQVQPGQVVGVKGNVAGLPLLEAIAEKVLQAGAYPAMMLDSDALQEAFIRYAAPEFLAQPPSYFEKIIVEQHDAIIGVRATHNNRNLSSVDPARQAASQKARQPVVETYMNRAARGDYHWVVTQYPCGAYAQDADMSEREYANFVFAATFADQPDPVAAWHKVDAEQARLVKFLQGKKSMVVKGANIDMRLSIEGRPFINCSGKNNMPDGEIFTGPVEESVSGWVKFTYPAVREGREVTNVELQFEEGKVVNATADKNYEYLLQMLNSDAGARYLGEFAIGTNYGIQHFTKSILFDEKIGGTLHMALGAGYPETNSKNKSALHWDMICDMRHESEIHVDGDLFYQNGQFMV